MAKLTLGSKVTEFCTEVDNLAPTLLKTPDALEHDNSLRGMLFLTSRKQTYKDYFESQLLHICNGKFADQSTALKLSLCKGGIVGGELRYYFKDYGIIGGNLQWNDEIQYTDVIIGLGESFLFTHSGPHFTCTINASCDNAGHITGTYSLVCADVNLQKNIHDAPMGLFSQHFIPFPLMAVGQLDVL
jgi:hypothetical protein